MATRSPVVVPSGRTLIDERRRAGRMQLLGEVHGTLVGLAISGALEDISEGGFSIESAVEFPAGSVQLFNLALGSDSGDAVVVQARSVHSERLTASGAPRFLTGFAFTADQPHSSPEMVASVVSMARAMAGAKGRSGAERRVEPRLNVLGEMHGEVLSLQAPLLVRDFSEGGCSVETHAELPFGSEHPVVLELTDSLSVSILARVVHSRLDSAPGRPARYVSGLQFVDPVGASRREIADMLGLLMSSPARE